MPESMHWLKLLLILIKTKVINDLWGFHRGSLRYVINNFFFYNPDKNYSWHWCSTIPPFKQCQNISKTISTKRLSVRNRFQNCEQYFHQDDFSDSCLFGDMVCNQKPNKLIKHFLKNVACLKYHKRKGKYKYQIRRFYPQFYRNKLHYKCFSLNSLKHLKSFCFKQLSQAALIRFHFFWISVYLLVF